MAINLLLAYFVVTTTALVVYVLWRRDGEIAVLRQQNAVLLETIFLAGNLPTAPLLRQEQQKRQSAVLTQPEPDSGEMSAEDWERSLSNMDRQAYTMFKREARSEYALSDPDEVFALYKEKHGLQAPFSVMRL
jgi:cell division protein FtsB